MLFEEKGLAEKALLIYLSVSQALISLAWGFIEPVNALYAISLGVPSAIVGLIFTTLGVARVSSQVPGGVLADRYGRRPLIALGYALIFIGFVLLGSARTGNEFLASFLIVGPGYAISWTVTMVLLTDVVPPAKRGTYIGFITGAQILGMVVGPPIGGFIAERYEAYITYFASASAAAAGLSVFLLKTREKQNRVKERVEKRSGVSTALRGIIRVFITSLKDRRILFLTFSSTINTFIFLSIRAVIIPLYGKTILTLTMNEIGYALGLNSVANFIVLFSTGKLEGRFSRKSLFIGGFFTYALAAFFFSFASNFYIFLGLAAVCGIGLGLLVPSQTSLLADLTRDTERGMRFSVFYAAGDLGMIVGPITTSLLIDIVDIRLPLYLFALGCSIFGLLALRLMKSEKGKIAP